MRIGIDARPLIVRQAAGITTYLRKILEYLQEADNINEYYLYSHKEIDASSITKPNFHVVVLKGYMGTLWLRYQLPSQLKKDGIEIFWGTEHVLPKKQKGVQYVLTIHDMCLIRNPSWGKWYNSIIQNTYCRRSIKQADRIIAVSESTKEDIIHYCKIDGDTIQVIYHGAAQDHSAVTAEAIQHTKEKYRLQKPFFLYVGTIEPRKNIETIVRAFEIVNQRQEYQLVLAGKEGWNCRETLDTIRSSSSNKDIVLPGYISAEEKESLYAEAAAMVFPSHFEGFGLPILEAMVREIPVITARNSSLPEVGGDAAIYIDNENDEKDLAGKMSQCLWMSEEEKKELQRKEKLNVSRFTWGKCGRETFEAITKGL